MAIAFLRYSNRRATRRCGGRYEYTDLWQVPDIVSVNSPDGDGRGPTSRMGTNTWVHEALNALNLPAIGDVSQDGGMVCAAIQPQSLSDQGTADLLVTWQEDPLTLPTEVHYFTGTKIKPAWTGVATAPGAAGPVGAQAGVPIRTSAGDRYNPPVSYEAPLERIEITFHCSLAWHDQFDWTDYLKCWNGAPWTVKTVDPENPSNTSRRRFSKLGTVFFADKRAPEVKEPFLHRLVTCVFLYDPDGHAPRVADLGPRAVFSGANKPSWWPAGQSWPTGLCPVIDAYGNPFGGLAELDGHGGQLFPTSQTDPTTMPAPVIKQWWPTTDDTGELFYADFNDLDLFTPERALKV